MGIEPTLSHLQCDALPIELSSPLGARWWEGRYTNASSWCPLRQKKLLLQNTPAVTMLSPWHSARCSTLVYLPSHYLALNGLDSSIGKVSHQRCESVGSIPWDFFPRKKSQDLYTSATVMYYDNFWFLILNFWNMYSGVGSMGAPMNFWVGKIILYIAPCNSFLHHLG